MFVTPQLKENVNRILTKLDSYADWLANCAAQETDWSHDVTRVLAAERALHIAVELATDAANLVIDALVMRDPGGYADIIRVLMEEKVVEKEWFAAFEGALAFRQRLIHGYIDVQAGEVVEGVSSYAGLFPEYATKLRTYLGI